MWDDQSVELLRKYWAEGLSASQIGARIFMTRNAVIGKAHRIGLPLRGNAVANRNRSIAATSRRKRKVVTVAPPPRQATRRINIIGGAARLPTEPLPPPVDGDVGRVAFADLEAHHCRFIPRESSDPTPFCGHRTVPGLAYCAHHAQRCYAPPKVKPRYVGQIKPIRSITTASMDATRAVDELFLDRETV